MNGALERILITVAEINRAVTLLGKKISEDYFGKDIFLIGVLKGSVIFLSDLIRNIDVNCKFDFIIANSYGNGAESSGKLNFIKDLESDIAGKHVLIVEDIIDTANTVSSLVEILKGRNPASLKVAAFLDKPSKRKTDYDADYRCFEIENEFVVGYGLDYAENYRNLPYIAVLKKSVYLI